MAKYVQGLNKDTGPIDQPEGTYRYAKNAVLSKRVGAMVNEHGNSTHVSIGDNHVILGTIEITDGRIIVFSVGEGDQLGQSRITVIDNGVATIILETEAGANLRCLPSSQQILEPSSPVPQPNTKSPGHLKIHYVNDLTDDGDGK